MTFFRNISTRAKIFCLVGIMALLLAGVGYLGYSSSAAATAALEDMYANRVVPIQLLNDSRAHVRAIQADMLFLLLTEDPTVSAARIKGIGERRQKTDDILKRYGATKLDPFEVENLAKVQEALAAYRAASQKVMALATAGGKDAEALAEYVKDVEKHLERYNEGLLLLAQYNERVAQDMSVASLDQGKRAAWWMVVLFFSSLIVLGAAGLLVANLIAKPLGRLREGVGRFAEGDLTVRFDARGKDEVGQVGKALSDMGEKLRDAVGRIAVSAQTLGNRSEEISALAQEANASVQESRTKADEVSVQMEGLAAGTEEINASVEEVAAGAQSTAQKGTDMAGQVEEAQRTGEDGIEAVRRVVVSIDGIARDAQETAGAVKTLGDRAREIQSFVSQIGGIADQTNLLALNAAIEAARAGDAGRGFAVVAEEVRKLAEESNTAARSIAELAGAITKDLDEVLSASHKNAEESQGSSRIAKETEGKIRKMIDALHSIAGSTQDLAAVSEEQAASSEEIASSVQDMSQKVATGASSAAEAKRDMDDVSRAAQKVAENAEDLAQLASDLGVLVSAFRFEDAPHPSPTRALPAAPAPRAPRGAKETPHREK